MYSLRLFVLAAVLLSLAAAAFDFRTRRIPNWLTLGGLLGGLAAHAASAYAAAGPDFALRAASLSALGALVVGLVPLVLWVTGSMGGGDVKVIAAIGAVCHASLGMTIVFGALVSTVVYVVLRLAWDGHFWRSLGSFLLVLANPFRAKERRVEVAVPLRDSVRFGPALALSALALLLVQGVP